MKDRIFAVRKHFNLTQQQFADKLGVKRGAIANYEIGRNEPVDSVLALICREFRVNGQWLRTGEGEMFTKIDEDLAFQDAIAEISISDTKRAARIRRILKAYWGMTDEEKDLFDSLIERICSEE